MTKEEKELLLKDLCGRLPYVTYYDLSYYGHKTRAVVQGFSPSIDPLQSLVKVNTVVGFIPYENIKPYLRPLSSMTEEEKKELLTLLVGEDSISHFKVENDGIANTDENIQFGHSWQYHWLNFSNENMSLYADWLNSHHFDYRGLIGNGLALEAPKEMY